LSDLADLSSGIIQGSGIGPIMFLSYINELIALLETYGIVVKAFADDVKMYMSELYTMLTSSNFSMLSTQF